MMGIRMPETCWAAFKRQEINLHLIAASSWLIQLDDCICSALNAQCKIQYTQKYMPCKHNTCLCVTAVKMCFQSERILTSLVNPCFITTNLIIIEILYLFKWHFYVGSCNKTHTEAGDMPVCDGKRSVTWLLNIYKQTNKRIPSIHPSIALQPLPGLGLPHKTPPFIFICSCSPLYSYPQQL
jgi:hypothetical protein